jgi:diacylglycerol kinase (ATP)
MKTAILFHNPQAGAEDHNKEDLLAEIEEKGYDCEYVSTKEKGWKETDIKKDLIVVAGGDGTVGKVLKELAHKKEIFQKNSLTAILTLGTANNIGSSLCIEKNTGNAIDKWEDSEVAKMDIGKIKGLDEKCSSFVESVGFGVFPSLLKKAKKAKDLEHEDPKQEVKNALELLKEVIKKYKPEKCTLTIDGKDYSGKYLMLEIMNIKFVGPSLLINPDADMSDGLFEVVLVTEDKRDELISFIDHRMENKQMHHSFRVVKGKEIQVKWKGDKLHVDDKYLEMDELPEITIKPDSSSVNILLPRPVLYSPQPAL